jgi:hypothetical protein
VEKARDDKPKAREVYGDLQNQHRRLVSALDTAALSLLEAEQEDMANHSVKLGQSINSFNLLTPDYSKLCAALSKYLSALPLCDTAEAEESNIFDISNERAYADDQTRTTNKTIIGRLMKNVRMGYYPTCLDHLAHIVRGIEFPEGITANLLDPCCGCGLALRFMANAATENGNDCKTYGVELDSYRAEEALTRVNRVGFGSYFHSRISNEAFHAMLLNPPYMSVMTKGGSKTRNEKRFLVDSTSNLLMGGLLIYIIPHYRLTVDIARFLCDNFDDLSIWKFTGEEFKKFKQVAIFGTRQRRRDGSEMISKLTSLVLTPGDLPEITKLPTGRYQLPSIQKDVALFKGAEFNVAELSEQLSNSKSFSRQLQRSRLDSSDKRPLLPLSLAQIGLVGGSGLINGLVDCDTPHIIKGRIVKEKRVKTDENTNTRGDLMSTTQTEVVSNKLIFNLLTPSGFISLTDYGGGAIVNSENDPSDDIKSHLGHFVSGGLDFDVADIETISKAIAGDGSLFPLGRVVITGNANDTLSRYDVNAAILRHQAGDWGVVTKSDSAANDYGLKHGERIISNYVSSEGREFWIITEWDRSYTTVLLPEDY